MEQKKKLENELKTARQKSILYSHTSIFFFPDFLRFIVLGNAQFRPIGQFFLP